MFSKSFVKRAGAAALSLVMAASLVPCAGAVDPLVDESYYDTLDYYGGLTDGSVVKSYRLNGNTDLSDIGSYTEVNNLTDRTEPEIEGDHVYFHLPGDGLKSFYFEGKTDKPYREMPFLISISYKMNGAACDAEDMAGQTGLAEITLDVKPNPAASAYQRNNFALEAATILKDSDLISIEAPGGQLQKVGDLSTALYLVLPGETRSFTLRIGSENFSFPGFTFLCQPATLAQLDQIAELKEAKEELEGAARDMSDSLDVILDSLEGMDGDLARTADGLDQLNRARGTISAGKGRVYTQADRTLADLTDLAEVLKPAVDHIRTSKEALAESTDQVIVLTETVDGLRPDLQDLRTDLVAIQGDMNSLNDTLELLKADGLTARDQLGALSGDLGDLNLDLDRFQGDVGNIEKNLGALDRTLDDLDDDLTTLQADLKKVVSRSGDLESSLDKLNLKKLNLSPIDSITINGQEYSVQKIESTHTQANSIYNLCVNPPEGLDLTAFKDTKYPLLLTKENKFAQYLQENAETVSKALVINQGGGAIQAGVAQTLASQKLPVTPETVGQEKYQEIFQQAYMTEVEKQAATYKEKLSDPVQAHLLSFLHYQWSEGINVQKQLQTLNQFNGFIQSGTKEINSYITALNGVTGGTSDLLAALDTLLNHVNTGALEDARTLLDDSQSLLGNARTALDHTKSALDTAGTTLEDAQALLDTGGALIGHLTAYDNQALNDHANTLFDNTAGTIDQLDAILAQASQLSQTVTKYEPAAQDALTSAQRQINAAVGLLGDLNTFGKSLEDLMRSAGTDLDGGSKTALESLSSTLRRASRGLNTTSTVRRAKDTVTRLVEDKWEEYTGGENNLLNMDSQAEKVSLTSPENPVPNTITLVLRSQEIKTDDEADNRQAARQAESEKLGFWGRVGRMFHDFVAIFTGD